MSEAKAIARRGFIARLAALPIFGAGFVQRAEAASNGAVIRQIEAAEERCHAAKQAYDDAVAAFETAIPVPHWTINYDDRSRALCRTFAYAHREHGIASPRYMPTVETLQGDLRHAGPHLDDDSYEAFRRSTRRMQRRVLRRKTVIAKLQSDYRLDALQADHSEAQRQMSDMVEAIFAVPAATFATAQIQARALCSYAAAVTEQYAIYQAGLYGRRLAEVVRTLPRAA